MLRSAVFLIVGLVACSPTTPTGTPLGAHGDAPRERCIMRRAAFDIGSATTKMKVAEIDRCVGRIRKILASDDAPVFYRDDLKESPKVFKRETMERGLAVLREMQAQAASHYPDSASAIATAAFRRAENAAELTARIEHQLGIPVRVITQLQEARLGFVGAVSQAAVEPHRAVVWDVGGGSMQITTLRDDGHLLIYEGKFASGQMRDFVITKVQSSEGAPPTPPPVSPNPVYEEHADEACDFAAKYAATDVPEGLRLKLADEQTVVVGIGALKYYGDTPASEPGASCTRNGLEARIDDLLGKSDAEIGGSYAGTAVSDRLLLLGFMRGLNIEKVVLADVDLTDGLFFEPEYWDDANGPRTSPQRANAVGFNRASAQVGATP
jgi:exopolyphosphatase/guanosine-5'-triphosphate,3'-diphosphate pyrophosphatase